MARPAAIEDFISWVRQARDYFILEPSGQTRKAFILRAVIQTHFKDHGSAILNDILEAVFPEGAPLYAVNIVPKCTAVFGILLHIDKGRYIPDFTQHGSLCDDRLPFDPAHRPSKFPLSEDDQEDFYTEFCTEQWRWCAPTFQRLMFSEAFEVERILPITFKELLGGGGSGTIYKIKIHKLYNELRTERSSDDPIISEESASTYVLKTYTTEEAKQYYTNEVAAFRAIRRNPDTNIIDYYGSYTHGESFNVLLEYADKGDLERYFREETEPRTGADIIKLWQSMFKLGQALRSIHQVNPNSSRSGPPIFQGWHQDVKPENIFIVSNDNELPYDWQFKLGDLGLSHFNRNVTTGNPTASDTRGTRTYGAPECYRADDFDENSELQVKQSVDIWSLGCVYSEAAAWVVGGYASLLEYREDRRAETRALRNFKDEDCFHNGEKALRAVNKSHRKTIASRRVQDCLTEQVIETMIKQMLEPDDRPTAMMVWRTSQRILEEAKEKLDDLIKGQSTSSSPHPVRPPPPPVMPGAMQGHSSSSVTSIITREPIHIQGQSYHAGDHLLRHSPESMAETETASEKWPIGTNGLHLSSLRHYSNGADVSNISHTKSKSVSFSEKADDSNALGQQKVDVGIARSTTGGLISRTNGWQSASTDAEPRSRPNTISSTPQDNQNRSRSIDGQRPFSAPSVAPAQQLALDGPSQSNNEVYHRQQESYGSSSSVSENQQKSSEDDSQLPRKTPALSVETMSLEEALGWKRAVRINKKVPLLHNHLLDRLAKRDHAFLIDDSASMAPYWKSGEVKRVFEALSHIVKDCDPDGTELYFTVSPDHKKSRDDWKLLNLLSNRKLVGSTDISHRLNKILDDYKATLRRGPNWKQSFLTLGKEKGVRPLSLYILTNGMWEDETTCGRAIINLVQTLVELGKERDQVGIQFISFGSDPTSLNKMKYLDDKLGEGRNKDEWLDIVDTEPSDGNVWKMLLGAISERFDRYKTYSITSPLTSQPLLSSIKAADF